MRLALRIAFLTSIWVLLWGRLSVANVASGVLVATLLLVLYPSGASTGRPIGRPRPVAFVRLTGSILVQLVVSNAALAREIVTPGSRIRTGVVACPLRTDSERIITFLANVLSLSPGTMPVHVQADPPAIYIHVLHLSHPDATRLQVARLERLAVRAFGSADAVAAVAPGVPRRRAARRAIDTEVSDVPIDIDESGFG